MNNDKFMAYEWTNIRNIKKKDISLHFLSMKKHLVIENSRLIIKIINYVFYSLHC